MEFLNIRFVGLNPENGKKLLLTIGIVLALMLIKRILIYLIDQMPIREARRIRFWSRQGISLAFALLFALAVLSIWFDDPRRLTTGLGLVTAGLAFALQKVVTSFAGYLIIIRGNTFSVGERITMGGIRGDVISLGFLQTTIMEMGQPAAVQGADPAMWIRGRQYTGRIVTVTNDKIFENPVFNYTRDFAFIWEELSLPIKYSDDRNLVEQILLKCVRRHTQDVIKVSEDDRIRLEAKYGIKTDDMVPRVFYRLTDNWLELSVRFIVPEHGVRNIKDAISRDLLSDLDKHGIGIASSTYEIVGLPALQLRLSNP
jgi:small-conductance mechanosensitive channel